jgi:hypothetical protein
MKQALLLAAVALLLAPPVSLAQQSSVQARDCKPEEVAVLENRLHVKCAAIAGQAYTRDIPYYAMALGRDSRQVAFTLDLLLAAKAAGRSLRIWFDMSDYASVPGCRGSDCRRLHGAAML